MIYDSIKELIDAIKEEECFKNYHSSLSVFGKPEVKSLMNEMNRLKEEKEDLARFGSYCDSSHRTYHIYKKRTISLARDECLFRVL